jgi:hypothetical protein
MMAEPHNPSDAPTPPPKRRRTRLIADRLLSILVVLLVLGGLFLLVWPSCRPILEASRNARSVKNLQQIGGAIQRFDDANGELPANSFAPDGQPLLSWRVHILPQLGEGALYQQFKLDEPWDSPHNSKLLDRMPTTYADPRQSGGMTHKTVYRGFSSPGAVFEKRPPRRPGAPFAGGPVDANARFNLAGFKDPLAHTILVVAAAEPVEWTKPDDLDAVAGKPFPKMGGPGGRTVMQALMADGSVRSFPADTRDKVLRALVTHSGGEPLPPNWDR